MAGGNYDHIFKILLIGDSGVGKTCMLLKFIDDTFNDWCTSTIGVDFKIKTITTNEKYVRLQLWDTTGLERFRSITKGYYRNSHGIIIVFDLTSMESFNNLVKWMNDVNKYKDDYKTDPHPYVILVGMKSDLVEKRKVNIEIINEFCIDNNVKYLEASAKNGNGIKEIFDNMYI
jgi:Ras-related protein Rab-1A